MASQRNLEDEFLANGKRLANPLPGEDIVISGISGAYSQCEDIHELRHKLLNKIDLIQEKEIRESYEFLPEREGKLKHVNKFDANFFGYTAEEAHFMDPGIRLVLEKTYEAILDAGRNPRDLQGKKVGVYFGYCTSESERAHLYLSEYVNGIETIVSSRGSFPNVISQWFRFNGPSMLIDTACSSSGFALDRAYEDIRNGVCDSAIVGGANFVFLDCFTLGFMNLGVCSVEAVCRVFDDEAKGYIRSEGVCVIFLQKSKDAKRVYAYVVHSKSNCDGYKSQGVTFPSTQSQFELLQSFYKECDVNPATVEFVEAHGTGTEIGDIEEIQAIERIFCPGRKDALPVGSVKSNAGHAEGISAVVSISKVLLTFELQKLLPNLHFKIPHRRVESFKKNILKVVTEVTPWNGKLAAVNAFGFGGANVHILLKTNPKVKKNGGKAEDNIPRLVTVSGPTQEAVRSLLDEAGSHPEDDEFAHLLHSIYYKNIPQNKYRGYAVLGSADIMSNIKLVYQHPPLWFVFSGLGSQWPGMGAELLHLPPFSEAIKKCNAVLKPLGVDIYKIIAQNDPQLFDNPINSFLGIAAVQIGLVDILKAIGVIPDGMVGHSIGELICAYADGNITLEQTILIAYYLGLACVEARCPKGAIALIEKCSEENMNEWPKDLELMAIDQPRVWYVAGPTNSLEKVKASGRKVTILSSSGVGCHSTLAADVRPLLLQYLNKVIPQRMAVSEKWISSSLNQAKVSSAQYFTNSLLGPMSFTSAWKQIPRHSLTLEISPHSVLPLTKLSLYNQERGIWSLLSTLGKLYESGIEMDLTKLYPAMEYPLSRGTPMISPHIKWEHSQDWFIVDDNFHRTKEPYSQIERRVRINLNFMNHTFYHDHKIDGRILFPATGYLVLVWETLALIRECPTYVLSVSFREVRFLRATHFPKSGKLKFIISIFPNTNSFEVMEGGACVVSGFIVEGVVPSMCTFYNSTSTEDNSIDLSTRDIYKELRLRGYNYSGLFRGLVRLNQEHNAGEVAWNRNWVTFMDNMLQMKILAYDCRSLFVPTYLEELTINVKEHSECITKNSGRTTLPLLVNTKLGIFKCGGIQIRGIRASPIPRRRNLNEPVLEYHQFVPYYTNVKSSLSLKEVLTVCVHTWLENNAGIRISIAELLEFDEQPLSPVIKDIVGNLPLINMNVTIFTDAENPDFGDQDPPILVEPKSAFPKPQKNTIIVVNNVINNAELLESFQGFLSNGGCIIAREKPETILMQEYLGVKIAVDYLVNEQRILMLMASPEKNVMIRTTVIHITQKNYDWLSPLQDILKIIKHPNQVLLVAQGEPLCGILGFFNCLQREQKPGIVRCVFILDDDAPFFDINLPFYSAQLSKNLVVNILKNGRWGSYRHLPLEGSTVIDCTFAYCNTAVIGDLSSLQWFQGKKFPALTSEDTIHVYYSAINFKDVMTATGRISVDILFKSRLKQSCPLGIEFSGRTSSGRRVMGMVELGAICTVMKSETSILWDVPDEWSLEEAATVPIVYGTVLYSLIIAAQVKKGESVLIHSGTGGIGHAAIRVALHYGLTIFTTVGTQEKRDYIRKNFPEIPSQNIGNSHDTSFEQLIMHETDGRGVDVVLNSLAGDKLKASVKCLAQNGRFIEIGKFDLANNTQLDLDFFSKNISYHGIMLDLFFSASEEDKATLHRLMSEFIKSGVMQPLKTRTVFSEDQLEEAFRFMAAGKHMGKVLIKLRDEEPDRMAVPTFKVIKAKTQFFCSDKLSYIIIGGLGGFGLELADQLVIRGARNLVLVSRKGISNGYQTYRIKIWRSYGTEVFISTQDISTREGVRALLKEAQQLAPVGGIFNLAAVLQDALFENQTVEKFQESAKGKAVATHHLDLLTREMCPDLEQFVVFSSVSCGQGNAGQTNYGMSNSVMERICEARKKDGLPALAIQWGAIGEVGLVVDMQEDNRELVISGTLQQTVKSCLNALDGFLMQPHPVVTSMVVAEKGSLVNSEILTERILGILGVTDIKKYRETASLADFGMDSMTGAEIKQVMEQEFEIFLSPMEIRTLTIEQLIQLSNTKNTKPELKSQDDNMQDSFLIAAFMKMMLGKEDSQNLDAVPLPSLNTSTQSVFLLPGMEGFVDYLISLTSQLNNQALSFTYDSCDSGVCVKDIVDYLMPIVLSRIGEDDPINFIGFSYGGILALELVAALESQGRHFRLVLIDSSPEYLASSAHKIMSNGMDAFQIRYIISLLESFQDTAYNMIKVAEELSGMSTWEERAQWVCSKLLTSDSASPDKLRNLIDLVMYRVVSLSSYKWEHNSNIMSPVLLLRPTQNIKTLEEDYGLSKICINLQPVRVIESNHMTILEHPDTAKLINEFFANE